MLIASSGSLPWYFQVAIIFVSLAIAAGSTAASYVLVKGNKAKTDMTLAQNAINSVTAELEAAQAKGERQDDEIKHLRELSAKQDAIIDGLKTQVTNLEHLVTGRDLIKAGFVHLGVPVEVLERASASPQ